MKINNIELIALALTATMGVTSCSKSLLKDVNENPNQAQDAPLSTLVTSTLAGSIIPFEGENARFAGIWGQTFTGSDRQYSAYDNYGVSASDFHWEFFYYGNIQQANLAITKADENLFYKGICQISKGNSFGTMTALWGDIPFTQANNLVGFPNPKFDAQLDIYAGAQKLLDDGIANINSASITDEAGVDFFYSGDATKWIKAANTMKARYYMHIGDYASAQTAANAGITDVADNMMIPHAGTYNQNMNVYASFGERDRQGYMGAQNAYLPTILDTTGTKNNAKTNEQARFNDLYTGSKDPATYDLNYSGNLFSATSSFPMITASENHLIMAEIAYRNNDDAGAITHLNHVRQILATKYPTGQYDDYVLADFQAGGIVDHGKGSALANIFHEIMVEKYASLVGQIEVFNDLRRTNNEVGISPKGVATNIPQRFLIPQDELNGNPNATTTGLFVETEVNK